MAKETEDSTLSSDDILQCATQIIATYVGNNEVPPSELATFINEVYLTLSGLAQEGANAARDLKPAVPINKSVTPDQLICLEDGKPLKMLRRYLRTHYDMSPEDYRSKWSLPHDYPMVAPNYAAKRSAFAKKIGLGKSRQAKPARRKRSS